METASNCSIFHAKARGRAPGMGVWSPSADGVSVLRRSRLGPRSMRAVRFRSGSYGPSWIFGPQAPPTPGGRVCFRLQTHTLPKVSAAPFTRQSADWSVLPGNGRWPQGKRKAKNGPVPGRLVNRYSKTDSASMARSFLYPHGNSDPAQQEPGLLHRTSPGTRCGTGFAHPSVATSLVYNGLKGHALTGEYT